MAGIETEK